eukprot:11177769-Lingulodinium_polyedra.AAC.1
MATHDYEWLLHRLRMVITGNALFCMVLHAYECLRMLSRGLCMGYACLRMDYTCLRAGYAWDTHGLRADYAWDTHGLRALMHG